MKILILLILQGLISQALHINFKQSRRTADLQRRTDISKLHPALDGVHILAAGGGTGGDNGLDINSVRDLIYLANITIGGNDYPLQLDTGSSDLWVKGATSPLPNSRQTETTYNLTYGIGWAFGHVAYAPTTFAGISIESQAYLDVSAAENPALGYGASGILGLGFTSLSTVDALVNRSGAETGRSLLYNLFAAHPDQPNFISFALHRGTEFQDDVEGSFALGEYVPKYASVADQPAIPTFPEEHPKRWNVLLDSFVVQGQTISVSTQVPGAPPDKAVVLLDSGTSYTYLPKEACDAIYKDVPGAKFDSSLGQWIVPCDAEIDMAFQFANQIFPVHPLDVTPRGIADPSICVGSFVPQAVTVGSGQFDWLIGDNVLRSMYSIYDFGDFDSSGKMGNPYIKLLSLTEPNDASREFVSVRGGTAKTNITYNVSKAAGSGQMGVSLSTQVANSLVALGNYLPAVLGILALNALVLLALVVVGIMFICRNRRSTNAERPPKRRKTRGRTSDAHKLTDMPLNPTISLSSGGEHGVPSARHSYHPVSMAITDDTYAPPQPPGPTLRKWDPEGLSPLPPTDRPRTTIFSGSHDATQDPDHELMVPPSPGFRMVGNERPRSIA